MGANCCLQFRIKFLSNRDYQTAKESLITQQSQEDARSETKSEASKSQLLYESFMTMKANLYKMKDVGQPSDPDEWQEVEVDGECQAQWEKGNFINEHYTINSNLQFHLSQEFEARQINSETGKYPYNCIGFLSAIAYLGKDKIPKQIGGTGFLIAPNLVLTAAHTVVDHKRRPYDKIKFYPQLHGEINTQTQIIEVTDVRVPKEYCHCKDAAVDFALIKLSQNVKREKYIMIGKDYPKCTMANIFGYPVDKIHQQKIYRQYGGGGEIVSIKESNIYYKIFTWKGQSGSPVIVEFETGLYFIVGIHSKYDEYLRLNYGCHLSDSKVELIKGWVEQLAPESKYIIIDFTKIKDISVHYSSGMAKNKMTTPEIQFYFKLIQAQRQKVGMSDKLRWLYVEVAKKYRFNKDYRKSLAELEEAAFVCQQVDTIDRIQMANIYFEMGTTLVSMRDQEQALLKFQQAIDIFRALQRRQLIATTLKSMGNCHIRLKRYQQARRYYSEAYEIDSPYFEKYPQKLAIYQTYLAAIYMKNKQYQQAEKYYRNALNRKLSIQQNDLELAKYFFNLANCLAQQAKLPKKQLQAEYIAKAERKFQESIQNYYQAITLMIELNLAKHQKCEKFVNEFVYIVQKAMQICSKQLLISFSTLCSKLNHLIAPLANEARTLKLNKLYHQLCNKI